MFKAIYLKEDREIVSLDETRNERIAELRQWAEEDQLVCPHCRHALWVRAGPVLRRHFAHKTLEDCPYSEESRELLEGRAVLYQWLQKKFPGRVKIEVNFKVAKLPHPVDCQVDTNGTFIFYWIFDSYPEYKIRDELVRLSENPRTFVQWIFLSRMMKEEEQRGEIPHRKSQSVLLAKMQRDFLRRTRYDACAERIEGLGKSIHFLDPEAEKVTTYRGLCVVHQPQLFAGVKYTTPLSLLQIHKNGEFAHPDELARYNAFKEGRAKRQRQVERKRKQKAEQRKKQLAPPARFVKEQVRPPEANPRVSPHQRPMPIVPIPATSSPSQTVLQPEGHQDKEGVCVFCGATTRDWWFYDGKTGSCKCKKCLANGRS